MLKELSGGGLQLLQVNMLSGAILASRQKNATELMDEFRGGRSQPPEDL
jgi:hypothetical protein